MKAMAVEVSRHTNAYELTSTAHLALALAQHKRRRGAL